MHVDDAFRAHNHSVRTRTNTTPNPWFKISDVEWGTALAEDVNWEFQWGTALEQRIEKYLQYDSEATATECTEQRTYYSSLIIQNCTTGEQWHIHATDPRIKTNRAATQSFVYFELDGTDACIGGVRELYSDGAGRPCFVHDRYLNSRDLQIIGNASVTSGRELPWDTDSELAWCPMLTNTYVRNLQGLCSMLPRLETDRTGYCERYTTNVAICQDEVEHPDTFFFRFSVDESGNEMKGMSKEQLDAIVLE